MARRKPKRTAPVQPTVTRKEYLRKHKDDRERRALVTVLGTVVIALGVFLGFGVWRQIQTARTPVARVDGEVITASLFARRVEYQRYQMLRNMASISRMASTSDTSFMQQLFGNQRTNIPSQTVDLLVDEALIRKEAKARGINVSDEDVRVRINKDLSPLYLGDTATATVEPTTSVTGTAASPAGAAEAVTPTLAVAAAEGVTGTAKVETGKPVTTTAGLTGATSITTTAEITAGEGVTASLEGPAATGTITDTESATATAEAKIPTLSTGEYEKAFTDYVQPLLDQTGLSRSDYEDIVRQTIYREKLTEALGAQVSITDKQVQIEYLMFNDANTAKAAADALAAGQKWADVADRYQAPPATATPVVTATESPTPEPPMPETTAPDTTTTVTTTNGITATGAITATGSVTDTAAATATATEPAPTATPDPYAFERGDPRWFTLAGLKEKLSLNDTDAQKVFDLTVGKASEPIDTSRGKLVAVVLAADAQRNLDAEELKKRKDDALTPWLEKRRTEAQTDRYPVDAYVPAEKDWFIRGYEDYAGTSLPTIDPNMLSTPLVEPTAEGGVAVGTPIAPYSEGAGAVVTVAAPGEGGASAPPSTAQP